MASCGFFSADEPPLEVKTEEAFVTLATNDVYAFGALVLAYSLRDVHTSKKLVVLVTRDVGVVMKHLLSQVFDDIQQVTLLCGKDPLGCPDRHRDNVRASFTKLHCWRLSNLSKCVFLDADTLVLANCDELFQWREFSAAPLRGWPDLFDTGVFVFEPSAKTHGLVMKYARDTASFDGVARGILNDLFGREWKADLQLQLPFTYNLQATSGSQFFDKAFLHYGACNAKIVHFWGSHKPWTQVYDWSTNLVHTKPGCPHRVEHLQKWWDVFTSRVQPRLARHPCGDGSQKPGLVCRDEICRSLGQSFSSDNTSSISHATGSNSPVDSQLRHESVDKLLSILGDTSVANIFAGASRKEENESEDRFEAWERGEIDYMGADAFENIQAKLDEAIKASDASKDSSSRHHPSLSETEFCEIFGRS